MQEIIKRLHSGDLKLPIKGHQEPDRIGLADGRQFYVGSGHGVPDELSEILQAYQGETAVGLPVECLRYEVSRKVSEKEEKENELSVQEREKAQDGKILSGEFSVRDINLENLFN